VLFDVTLQTGIAIGYCNQHAPCSQM